MISSKTAILSVAITITLGAVGCSDQVDGQSENVTAKSETAATSAVIDVSVAQAKAMIDGDTAPMVLDVRTPEEFAEAHIEGAINIDFRADNFTEKLSELDRDQRYIVHCRSGRRSSASMEIFEELGFTDIQHLFEGFNGWEEAGLPVVQ